MNIAIRELTLEAGTFEEAAQNEEYRFILILKRARDSGLPGTAFDEWVRRNFSVDPSTARKRIQAVEHLGPWVVALPVGKCNEILGQPPEADRHAFLTRRHVVPSSKQRKTVIEMSRRELRDVKRAYQKLYV